MFKLYLTEYARAKAVMEAEIEAKTDVIVEHLIKLILMPNNIAYKLWQCEICSQLHTIHKIKGKNKYPSYSQLIEWTYEYALDDIIDINRLRIQIKHIEQDYNVKITMSPQGLSKSLKVVCKLYFEWLCNKLQTYSNVANTDIYRQLDYLIRERE